LYGTDDARVGLLTEDGELQWLTMLKRAITAVQGWPERDRVLAGDKVGNVYLLNGDGEVIWEINITQFNIASIHPVGESQILVGDQEGALYLLDESGQVLLTRTAQTERDKVAAIYALPDGKIGATRQSGQVHIIDPEAQKAAQLAKALRPVWYALDGILLVALAVAVIYVVEPWRLAVGDLAVRVYRARLAYLFLLPGFALTELFLY
jgi:hypothetical protein